MEYMVSLLAVMEIKVKNGGNKVNYRVNMELLMEVELQNSFAFPLAASRSATASTNDLCSILQL